MGISLQKGANISLTRCASGLEAISVGLGWDVRATEGTPFDLDAVVFLLTELGDKFKVRNDLDMIFYNNLVSTCGSVRHMGDNLTGQGDGDDEVIKLNLKTIPIEVVRIRVGVSIHEAAQRRQNFGMVNSAFIRVVNENDGTEMARYDLSEEASAETAMIFGEIYLYNGEWKFKAIGQGFAGGLAAMAKDCGVNVD